MAGTSHLTIAPMTAGRGWNSVYLAEPAACLESSLSPQQPLPASPSAGCVGCTRLGDEAGSLAQHPPSSHSRTRFACMLGRRMAVWWVPTGLRSFGEHLLSLSSLPRLLCPQPEASPSLCCMLTQGPATALLCNPLGESSAVLPAPTHRAV